MDSAQPRRFQFTLQQWLMAMGWFALGLLWLPILPVLVWVGFFLGPQADSRRNLLPVLVIAAAFYVPALLCIFASQQSHWDPHLAWDHVAQEYLWAAPCLPGFLAAIPMAGALHVNATHPAYQAAIGLATLLVLTLFTRLARMHLAALIALAVLAFCYSFVLSALIPAGMRI